MTERHPALKSGNRFMNISRVTAKPKAIFSESPLSHSTDRLQQREGTSEIASFAV
jgi:hypothetical protein